MAARSGSATAKNAESTPTLEDLWGQPCGNCTVGVLLVTLYDPDSLHEVGQDLSADNQQATEGRYETQCFACGQHLSHVLGSTIEESGDE